jgi:hypothetical protein
MPEWKNHDSHPLWMLYGMEVLCTLRGYLGTEAQLPREDHIGDMWVVGDLPRKTRSFSVAKRTGVTWLHSFSDHAELDVARSSTKRNEFFGFGDEATIKFRMRKNG